MQQFQILHNVILLHNYGDDNYECVVLLMLNQSMSINHAIIHI